MIPRRRMLEGFVASAAGLSLSGLSRAVESNPLPPTPSQTAGPFYPLALPADSNNDLIHIAGRDGTAKGTVTYVSGRVLDPTGRPVSGARVEIWQSVASNTLTCFFACSGLPPRFEQTNWEIASNSNHSRDGTYPAVSASRAAAQGLQVLGRRP